MDFHAVAGERGFGARTEGLQGGRDGGRRCGQSRRGVWTGSAGRVSWSDVRRDAGGVPGREGMRQRRWRRRDACDAWLGMGSGEKGKMVRGDGEQGRWSFVDAETEKGLFRLDIAGREGASEFGALLVFRLRSRQ